MNVSEEHIALFEAYLQASLSEKEVLEFDARLSYDSEFKESFDTYRYVEKGVKQHFRNEVKLNFQKIDNELDNKKSAKDSFKKNPTIKWLILSGAVAASILFMIFINYGTGNSPHEELVVQYWPIEVGLPVKMSTKGKYDDAINAYKLEKWIKAEMLFEQIDSDTSDYFIGIINYEQKEFSNAITSFESIPQNSTWYEESQFRLALIYLHIEQESKSKSILKHISKSNSLFKIEAEILLLEL